jgi:aminopeptidase N
VNMDQETVSLKEAVGKEVPSFILFNSSGQGYGLFPVDAKMIPHILELKDPVMRASAYISLYENMLSGRIVTPKKLLSFYQSILSKEQEELNLSQIAGQISDIYWRLISPAERTASAASLENDLWTAMQSVASPNKKKVLFRTYQSIALSRTALDQLYQVWKDKKPPQDVRLNEDEYASLALSLAVKDYKDTIILQEQLARLTNPDRKARLEFLMPAVSGNESERDRFFASLKDQKIRKKEAWVGDALGYLHHPVRAASSIKYLKESLDMLEEIQLTGDIFFPSAWLNGTLGAYQSREAADIIRNFIAAHPDYNPKLKAKVLQAADPVFRAEKLVRS